MTIYFIRGVTTGLTKIGYTRNPETALRRFANLQIGSPDRLMLVGLIEGHPSIERELHDHFHTRRRHGEWFALTAQDLSAAIAFVEASPFQRTSSEVPLWHRKRAGTGRREL